MLKRDVIFLLTFLTCGLLSAQTRIHPGLIQSPALSVSLGNDINIEKGQSYALGDTLNIDGGSPEYSYSWINDTEIFSTDQNPVVFPETNSVYILTISDKYNCSASDTLNVNIYTVVSLDSETDEWKIYPNPANEFFIIEAPGKCEVRLTDIHGSLIWAETIDQKRKFEIPENQGVYFILIEYNNHTSVNKLIVTEKQ